MWKGNSRWPGPVLAALIGLTAACSDDATGPQAQNSELSSSEVEFLVLQTDGFLDGFIGQEESSMQGAVTSTAGLQLSASSSEPITTTIEFTLTRNCPAGGRVSAEGTVVRVVDREAGTMDLTFTGEKKKVDCAFQRGDVTITVNGEAEWEAFRHRENGELVGLQTKDVMGEFSYATSDGREGACEFDLHMSFDPATRTKRIQGTYCGREIDRTRQV
ncbi:MAG: hypothetical protein ACE5HP_07045 [Gemmatimonadota bacterium]